MITKIWHRPATIERNNFKFKSLSCWSYNIAIGCAHACRFCYVPEVSTRRMSGLLAQHGVSDPDAEWGAYVFLRQWDERAFRRSLAAAERTPLSDLNPDGNRAVMLCTTTDPYQVIRNDLPERQRELQNHLQDNLVARALRIILEESSLNVRILTRSPLARRDFDLMAQFGNRLLFGMSLPTLNNQLAKIYEPKASAPSQRLATLQAAKLAGLNVYVAVAPVYPECDAADMEAILRAVKELDPVTIFMEPINIRADNISRIGAHAQELNTTLKTEVFNDWPLYALDQLIMFEHLAEDHGLKDRLHLWPDQALGSKANRGRFGRSRWNSASGLLTYSDWLHYCWSRISAWPGMTTLKSLNSNVGVNH